MGNLVKLLLSLCALSLIALVILGLRQQYNLTCCYSSVVAIDLVVVLTEITQSDQNAVGPVSNGIILYLILRL